MLRDLAALAAPLIVAGAFVAGVILFLRQQMGGAPGDDDAPPAGGITEDGANADAADPGPAPSDRHPKV
jgi:hypothetical protein